MGKPHEIEANLLENEWAIQAYISGVEHGYLKYALTNGKPDKLYCLYEKANMHMEIE